MPDPPDTSSKPSVSEEVLTVKSMDDEKVQREGREHKVPQDMVEYEYEGLWQEGSFDKTVVDDVFIEKAVLVEEDAEAGPSGVEHPVAVQQDVCRGDDHPELSDYEKLRERNIREREEAMKEAMGEINEAKQEMWDNAPRAKEKGAVEEGGGRRKKKKAESVVELRRSGRKRKPVSYVVEEYSNGRSKKSRKTGHKKTISKPDSPPTLPSSSCNLCPQKPIVYSPVPEPEADSFIWCSVCKKEKYEGCEKHVPYFGDNKELNLKVEKGSQGLTGGEGVVNKGKVVPKGVLFCPYSGKFIPAAVYEMIKSDNARESRDQFHVKTVGYINPGMHPNPQLHWRTKINSPNQTEEQNLMGFQLAGQIFYRVTMDISMGKELLVWHGTSYVEEAGIAVEIVDAIECEYCGTWMVAKTLEEHLGKGGNVYKCVVKQAMEMVMMAESEERKHVCRECGKGYKTKYQLSEHGSVHTRVKSFKCDVENCGKSYAYRSALSFHKKNVHEGIYYDCAECGKRFGGKSTMRRHYKTVHDKIRAYKCSECGRSFGQACHMKVHMESVHSK